MGHLERMKHGCGIKDRDDKSSGVEIHMTDVLAKINPTDPLLLAKQTARRNLNCSDSSGISLARAEASRWACRNSRRPNTAGRVYRTRKKKKEKFLLRFLRARGTEEQITQKALCADHG